jgi:Zn-dependent protease with chaperone function
MDNYISEDLLSDLISESDIPKELLLQEGWQDMDIKDKVLGTASGVLRFLFWLYQAIKFAQLPEDKMLSKKVTDALKKHPIMKKGGNLNIKVIVIPAAAINAFVSPASASGFGEMKIFMYGGLVNLIGRDSDDVVAIGLHEVGHFLKQHLSYHAYMQMAGTFGLMKLSEWIMKYVKENRKFMAVLATALLIMSQLTVMAGMAYLSRAMEKQADQFAIDAGYGPQLASGLQKMQKFGSYSAIQQKCGKACQAIKKIDNTLSTHPETEERIKDILKRSETFAALKSGNNNKLKQVALGEIRRYTQEYLILNG